MAIIMMKMERIINFQQVKVVRKIFNWYLEGKKYPKYCQRT